jgi:hypothetical protein
MVAKRRDRNFHVDGDRVELLWQAATVAVKVTDWPKG